MNIIVSVVVGLSLFSGVFCNTTDTTGSKCTNSQYSDCTCGPVDRFFAYSNCASNQNANQYFDSYENQEVCSVCTKCVNRTTGDWWFQTPLNNNFPLYIFLDSLPVLIWVPLILFFNIDLASGPGHSLVFMYQVLVALFHISAYNQGYESCTNGNLWTLSVSGLLVLFNAPLLASWPDQTLTHYSLGYVKVLIAGVLVAVSFFLTTCTQCPLQCCRSPWAKLRRAVHNWRERHLPQQRSVLTGMCSVAILMYGSLVEVSFRLLFRCELPDNICHCSDYNYFNGSSYNATFCCMHEHTVSEQSLCWAFSNHLPYFIPAWIMVGVAVLLSLPFFYHPGDPALASFQTGERTQFLGLHKLGPLLSLFQGVYKPKLQFFTGLHLLYRIALWSVAAFFANNDKIPMFSLLSVVILAVHSLFQPFESRRHNYVETLLMVNVVLITVLLNYSLPLPPSPLYNISLLMVFVLTNLPLWCVIVYYTYKFIRRCCCCCKRREYHQI